MYRHLKRIQILQILVRIAIRIVNADGQTLEKICNIIRDKHFQFPISHLVNMNN